MNSIDIIGRITKDPELRRTQEGVPVCSFTLAVNRPRVKDTVDFINCVAWRQSAEFLFQYGHKADHVAITGSLQSRRWQDKEGRDRTEWEVIAEGLELLSSKRNSEENTKSSGNQNACPGAPGSSQKRFSCNDPQGIPRYPYVQQGFSELENPGKLPF